MIVGLAGAAITVAAIPISSVRLTTGRTLLALSLMVLHVAACVGYYFYVQHNPADTATYYFDRHHFGDDSFQFGMIFVIKATQVLKSWLGGSYFECFLFFQGIGFWGVMLLMRCLQEINHKMGAPQSTVQNYLLFLPSVHFWTVAIGKDGPLFFAVTLCIWAALNWKKRWVCFGLGLATMVLFRPHIALIVVMAVAAAAALHPAVSFGRKVALLTLTAVGGLILAGTIQSTFHVDVMSANSLATFVAERNDVASKVGGSTTFGNASLFIRFTSLLFRPLFFDARNFLGMVASIENLGSVLLFSYLLKNWGTLRVLSKRVFFIKFCAMLVLILIITLTAVNYNVGTGLRERVMVIPPLFCIFMALWVLPRRSARQAMAGAPARAPAQIPLSKAATEVPL